MNNQETVYCTKYALTKGITKILGHEIASGSFYWTDRFLAMSIKASQWTRDPAQAIQMAESLREKRLESLRKEIEKVTSLEFTLP